MENHIDHPLTLTVEQAAKLLGIGRSTAYELVHTGEIPSLRLGRRIVVPVGQIADRLGVDRAAVWTTVVPEEPSVASPVGSRPPVPPRTESGEEAAATLFWALLTLVWVSGGFGSRLMFVG